MTQFISIADVLPEGKSGNVEIRHTVVTPEASKRTELRAMMHPEEYIAPGRYAQLFVNGGIMMSDTDMEHRSNGFVCAHAKGRVLIAGLGIGMIIHPIAAKPDVTDILVIEKSPDVIKLVAASLPKKARVVEGDIFTWTPEKGAKFETIYFDIWPNISTGNLPEMAKLHRRFGRFKASPKAYMESWQRGRLQGERERDKRNPWASYKMRCGGVRSV
jgi:spermidine synthase